MNAESRVSVRWPVLVVAAVVLLAVGAGAAYVGLRSRALDRWSSDEQLTTPGTRVPAAVPATAQPASSPPASAPLPDVVVTLSQEAAKRAGISCHDCRVGWNDVRWRSRSGLVERERVQAGGGDASGQRRVYKCDGRPRPAGPTGATLAQTLQPGAR